MLIWGYRTCTLDLGPSEVRRCAGRCGEVAAHRWSVSYQYNHLWYVFGFVNGARCSEVCSSCGHAEPIPLETVKARLGRHPVPQWERIGLLALAGMIAALVLFAVLLRVTGPPIRNIPDLSARVRSGDPTAVATLRAFAQQGDLPSQLALADLLVDQAPRSLQDPGEALRWAVAAAEQGDVTAQVAVAIRYETGVGTDPSPTEALRWYRTAAEGGSPTAWNSLGAFYLAGTAVDADPQEAVRWFRRAAEAGDAPASFNLGMLLLNGIGLERDPVAARGWLERAAADRLADGAISEVAGNAMFQLGQVYENGWGTDADIVRALGYYQEASTVDDAAKAQLERLRARLNASAPEAASP